MSEQAFTIQELTEERPATPTTTTEDLNSPIDEDAFFHSNVGRLRQGSVSEHPESHIDENVVKSILGNLRVKQANLRDRFEKENIKIQRSLDSPMPRETDGALKTALEQVERLQEKIKKFEEQERRLENQLKDVTTINYRNVDAFMVRHFLYSINAELIEHIAAQHKVPEQLEGKLPRIVIKDQKSFCTVQVTGFTRHHQEFKSARYRLEALSNNTKSSQDFYRRTLNRLVRTTQEVFKERIFYTSDCQCYVQHFQRLVKEKVNSDLELFNDYILDQAKQVAEKTIRETTFKPWQFLRNKTNEYMTSHPFIEELEQLKSEALEEFLREKVFQQQVKMEKPPTRNSLTMLNEYIDKVKTDLRTNAMYRGDTLEQWKHIPKLLRRAMLYYRCFLLQLPLYESSKELMRKISRNTVVMISTSTGSGKERVD